MVLLAAHDRLELIDETADVAQLGEGLESLDARGAGDRDPGAGVHPFDPDPAHPLSR